MPVLPLPEVFFFWIYLVLVDLLPFSTNVIQALVWNKNHSPLSVNVFLTLVLKQVAHAWISVTPRPSASYARLVSWLPASFDVERTAPSVEYWSTKLACSLHPAIASLILWTYPLGNNLSKINTKGVNKTLTAPFFRICFANFEPIYAYMFDIRHVCF